MSQAFEDLHDAQTVNTGFGYAVGDEGEHVRVLLTPGSSGMCSSPSTHPDRLRMPLTDPLPSPHFPRRRICDISPAYQTFVWQQESYNAREDV